MSPPAIENHAYEASEIASHDEDEVKPCCFVIHTVECEKVGTHGDHASQVSYFDRPRMFAGDNKASMLRGERPIENVADYLEQHDEACVVVYRSYSCSEYHQVIKEQFTRLRLPIATAKISPKLRHYLFTLTKNADLADPDSETMMVRSESLKETLAEFDLAWKSTLGVEAPYISLYHHRRDLEDELASLDQEEEKEEWQHLSVLCDYLHEQCGPDYDAADALFARRSVSPEHFLKLFTSNEIVVSLTGGHAQGYMVTATTITSPRSLTIDCWRWAFGGLFRKESKQLFIRWPSGDADTISMQELEVYPLKYDNEMQEALRERGNRFWSCRAPKFVSCNEKSAAFEVRTGNPRFMVDMRIYHQMNPSEGGNAVNKDDLGPEAMARKEPPEEPFVLLLPPTIPGYGFNDKKWRTLAVQSIEEITWNVKAFERLVLDQHKKDLVKALVTVHVTTSASTDVIEGKGNGLIILLHGSPGTGKTMTAESIAELTHKPLYRVTCGDMGTEAETVEKYLESVFYIGTTWECVVLLDEADVFLEERSQADLQRNALVSVFLRTLEYYEGILILTSNRVGTFDEAFKSRIQLAIHYPPLDQRGRFRIWSTFINLLAKEDKDIDLEELNSNINLLSQHNLNGRQIRNVVKTARQLAFYKGEQLTYGHFESVISVATEFENYLVETQGHTYSAWAREEGLRAE